MGTGLASTASSPSRRAASSASSATWAVITSAASPGIEAPHLVDHLGAAHLRHPHVGEQRVVAGSADQRQRLGAVGGQVDLVAPVADDLGEVLGELPVVVDDQVAAHGRGPWPLRPGGAA